MDESGPFKINGTVDEVPVREIVTHSKYEQIWDELENTPKESLLEVEFRTLIDVDKFERAARWMKTQRKDEAYSDLEWYKRGRKIFLRGRSDEYGQSLRERERQAAV